MLSRDGSSVPHRPGGLGSSWIMNEIIWFFDFVLDQIISKKKSKKNQNLISSKKIISNHEIILIFLLKKNQNNFK